MSRSRPGAAARRPTGAAGRAALLALAVAALLGAGCRAPGEPVRYEDLVASGRLAALPGVAAGRERLCADETRFAVAVEPGAELEVPLVVGRTPRLAAAACLPEEPASEAEPAA
ncbi:MAG TPA: hypothetical protein VF150_13545, partial [Thermoanaerobaculia bacterium]